jgi:Dyp-type peroxidase family
LVETPVTGSLELADIQGLLVRGYSQLRAAAFQVLEISDVTAACRWLASIAAAVNRGDQRSPLTAVNVALTAPALLRLGVDEETISDLSAEFRQGMTEPSRARALGDVDASAPGRWAWGGPGGRPAHVLLLLYAAGPAALADLLATHGSPPGLDVVAHLDTVDLDGREQFGFHDGISQPSIEGLPRTGPRARSVRAGEFVLGYPNELTRRVGSSALARNGSYLVLRQLEQDVDGLWRYCAEVSGDGQLRGGASVALAARMVGRWPSGAPLVLSPDGDDPTLADADDFGYHDLDPRGTRCPIGAHVRRTNPRDALAPDAGSPRSVAIVRQHRILRRGRSYGSGSERGLHFICLNASLSRQFEFLQRSWVCDPHFNGLYEDADPLIGPRRPLGDTFTMPGAPVRRRLRGLPRFVTTRGGAYFFLPGVRTLGRIAGIPE